jgi:hypothetical protein
LSAFIIPLKKAQPKQDDNGRLSCGWAKWKYITENWFEEEIQIRNKIWTQFFQACDMQEFDIDFLFCYLFKISMRRHTV